MPLCVQHRGGSSLNAKGQQTVLPDLYGNAGTKMTLIPASILTLEVSRKLLMRFQKGNPGSVHEAERVDARFRHIGHVADAVGDAQRHRFHCLVFLPMIKHSSSSAYALHGFLSTAVFSRPSVLRNTREAGQTTLRRLVSFSGNKWSGATYPIRTCRKATGCPPTGNSSVVWRRPCFLAPSRSSASRMGRRLFGRNIAYRRQDSLSLG